MVMGKHFQVIYGHGEALLGHIWIVVPWTQDHSGGTEARKKEEARQESFRIPQTSLRESLEGIP